MVAPTYDSLVAEVAKALWNESEEVTDLVPQFLTRAEQRIFRDLGTDGFTEDQAVTLMANTRSYTIPSGLRAWRFFYVTLSDGRDIELAQRPEAYVRAYWPSRSDTGQPRYYAILDPVSYVVAPTPDATYEGRVGYYRQITPLSDGNQTSWLTENAYGLLLAACCAEGAHVLAGPNTTEELSRLQQTWEAVYKRDLEALQSEQRRRERSNYQPQVVPVLNKGHG